MSSIEAKPPRIPPRLKAKPDIRGLYWCDFPEDAHLPEFWKCRPVLVVSFKNDLTGCVTVIPCSSQAQDQNRWAVKLSTTIDSGDSWAICDKVTSVAVSRLSMDRNGKRRLPEAEFNTILKRLLEWLPVLPSKVEPALDVAGDAGIVIAMQAPTPKAEAHAILDLGVNLTDVG